MKLKVRHQDEREIDAFRIEKDGLEYLLQDTPGGIKIVEVTSESITIRPQVANAIVLVTQ